MNPANINSHFTLKRGINSEKLYKFLQYVKDGPQKVHSLLILYNGSVITDINFYPYHRDVSYYLNCCTASIISVLTGIALEEGLLGSLQDKVSSYFPEYASCFQEDFKKDIALEHLLLMTSGLVWDDVNNIFGEHNYDNRMHNSEDPVKFILEQPMKEQPGKSYNHCLGTPHLLSAILQKVTGMSTAEYAEEKLFKPLGITGTQWFTDKNGICTGGNGLVMTAGGLAKIGQLYLNHGIWEGRRLVPESWISRSTGRHAETPSGPWSFYGSGYLWNINRFGGYSAKGVSGQYMAVVPNLNLVAVMIAELTPQELFWPETLMETFIIPALRFGVNQNGNQYDEKLKELSEAFNRIPAPKAQPELPPAAGEITGRKLVFNDCGNVFEVSFDFSNKNCCIYRSGYGEPLRELKAGLCGIYEITGNEAAMGQWLNSKTLSIKVLYLGMYYETEHRYTFYKDKVVFKEISPGCGIQKTLEGKFQN